MPREDIALRPEFTALFEETGVDDGSLITLSDVYGELEAETRWILVDHNKLEGALGKKYGSKVVGVIDHHDEESAVPQETGEEPRVIEKCGSCTSLVVRCFRGVLEDEEVWTKEVAKFALGSILIDTKDLRNEVKTEPTDIEAVEFLTGILEKEGKFKKRKFFKLLNAAKKDIEELPLQGILRKDYKQWTEDGMELGMSTVVKPMKFLVSKAKSEGEEDEGSGSWEEAAKTFMDERDLDIWAVMTTFTTSEEEGGEYMRELFLQWRGENGREAVDRFEKETNEELGLEKKKVDGVEITAQGSDTTRLLFRQRNVAKSRKQVAPLLRKAMRG